jgi:hypothetical protein
MLKRNALICQGIIGRYTVDAYKTRLGITYRINPIDAQKHVKASQGKASHTITLLGYNAFNAVHVAAIVRFNAAIKKPLDAQKHVKAMRQARSQGNASKT